MKDILRKRRGLTERKKVLTVNRVGWVPGSLLNKGELKCPIQIAVSIRFALRDEELGILMVF